MNSTTQETGTFLFFSPEAARFLSDNEVDIGELLSKARVNASLTTGPDPASDRAGQKDPATIILASAAAIAAATPVLKELIRNLTGKNAVIRQRRLVPVEDSNGNVVTDAQGVPLLHWTDVADGVVPEPKAQAIHVNASITNGIEISFGDK